MTVGPDLADLEKDCALFLRTSVSASVLALVAIPT